MIELPSVARALQQSGLAAVDAQVLLAHVLERNRAWLVAHAGDVLSPEHARAFDALARRRRAGEPVAYLTGTREFWGMPLRVSPAVLVPRPETETLVEVALARLLPRRALRVLDLGRGSGAVALAIARERPLARVVGSDVSGAALAVARGNGQRLSIANVEWVESDWYAGLPADASFDAIVSNPPYVRAGDPHLREGDLRFEPAIALSPGGDDLGAIRRIVAGALARLSREGLLAVEHGYDQSDAVQDLFRAAALQEVGTQRDIAGLPRVTFGLRRA
jgi:release factor glutamine methyltransferase